MTDPIGECVYVIGNGEAAVYVGRTADLKKRLAYHNSKLVNFTKRIGGVWRVLWHTRTANKRESYCIEAELIMQLNSNGTLGCLAFKPRMWNRAQGDWWHYVRRSGEQVPKYVEKTGRHKIIINTPLTKAEDYLANVRAGGPLYHMINPKWPEVRRVLADLGLQLIEEKRTWHNRRETTRYAVDKRGEKVPLRPDAKGSADDFIDLAHDHVIGKTKARRAEMRLAAAAEAKQRETRQPSCLAWQEPHKR
jgi:predicted GIY-YIG superfamily endonuclease